MCAHCTGRMYVCTICDKPIGPCRCPAGTLFRECPTCRPEFARQTRRPYLFRPRTPGYLSPAKVGPYTPKR